MATILTGTMERTEPIIRASRETAWRTLGWFGFILATIGFGQMALHLYPTVGFGSPEWEFGTMAQLLGALPLPTIGVAAMAAAAHAQGRRRAVVALAVLSVGIGLATLAVLALFWTVAPLALKQAPAIASVTIRRTVAQSTLNGFGFAMLYFVAAIAAVRSLKR